MATPSPSLMPQARHELVDVFLDYENIRKLARTHFCPLTAGSHEGMVHPVRLAELLCSRRRRPSALRKVHVYRGRPNPQKQAAAASYFDTAVDDWEQDSRCSVHHRPLKYRVPDPNYPGVFQASEKGIDVALAIDVAKTSLSQETTALIVFSTDTDLLPAIEFVYEAPNTHIEVACWDKANPLKFPSASGKRVWCHNLTESDFRSVCIDSFQNQGYSTK